MIRATEVLDAGTVLATAGHVDHGKSTLVRALTGTDPDRLAEEKARGLTIDLGFAATTLPSGRRISFVDVPGHVRFIKNMLAGAGSVQACVVVVAATEGWKPQSEEHLRILELLGVQRGVIVLSMRDRADPELVSRRRAEIGRQVEGTFLAGAPVTSVDSVSGRGLPDLVEAIDRMVSTGRPASDVGRARLWIDRSFPVAGAGTVATGTLTGGCFAVGQSLISVPGDLRGRIRSLQSHGNGYAAVGPGNRVAVNLAGVAHRDLRRGQALVTGEEWWATERFDARVTVLPGLGHPLGRRGAYQLYVGSAERAVRLRLLGGQEILPGEVGLARLFISGPLPLVPGDRFVLRESGRGETVGGGIVLDVDPVTPAVRARPDGRVETVIEERGWVDAGLLVRLTGVRREPGVGRWVVSDTARLAAIRHLEHLVEASGPDGVDLSRLDERQRALARLLPGLEIADGRLRRPAAGSVTLAPAPAGLHPWLEALREHPFEPPPPDGVDRARLRQWLREGAIVESDGVYFAAAAVAEAARTVARLLTASEEGVTASAVRSALGTSRKYLIPLLGHLDRTGVTRRRGDLRVAGPRLPGGQ